MAKQDKDYPEEDRHHWSGWPGAFCLKCHGYDPIEKAFADGNYKEVDDPSSPMGFSYDFSDVEVPPCPIKGILKWDHDKGQWKLVSNAQGPE